MRQSISATIASAMKEKGITVYQVAKATGIQATNVKKVVTGSVNYTIDQLEKVMDAVGLTVEVKKKG